MGEVPDWYAHIQAARYLNVAPWELADVDGGEAWRDMALTAARAEAAARASIAEAQRHAKH